jgi:cytochrome c oxidase subunit 1
MLLAASLLLFVYNIAHSLKHGEIAGNNPWDAPTLEWAIPSPPPVYNFAQLPQVGHRDPLWWDKYDQHTGHGHGGDYQDISHVNDVVGHIHMPNPSIYPLITAAGIFIAALGLLFNDPRITIGLLHLPILCALGMITVIAGIYGWAFEPAADPEPVAHDQGTGHSAEGVH